MPNWVTCRGYIELPENASEGAKDIFDKLVANESEDGWFSNVRPCPEEMHLGIGSTSGREEYQDAKWLRKHSRFKGRFGTFKTTGSDGHSRREFRPSKKYLQYLTEEYGHTNWYSWNVANYGTKWDVKLGYNCVNNNRFEFDFDSAWSPPKTFFEWLANQGLEFELNYEEPGCQFYGQYSHADGSTIDDYFEGEDYILYAINDLDQDAESLLNLDSYSNYKEFKEATKYKSKQLLEFAKNFYHDRNHGL